MYSGFLLQDTSHSYCETLRIPAAVQQDHFLLRYVQLHFLLIKYHSTSKCCITLWQSSVIFKHCMKLLSSEYCQLTAWSQIHIKKNSSQAVIYVCWLNVMQINGKTICVPTSLTLYCPQHWVWETKPRAKKPPFVSWPVDSFCVYRHKQDLKAKEKEAAESWALVCCQRSTAVDWKGDVTPGHKSAPFASHHPILSP